MWQRDVGSGGETIRLVWMTWCLPWLSHVAVSETSHTLCASFSPLLFHLQEEEIIVFLPVYRHWKEIVNPMSSKQLLWTNKMAQ